MLDVGSWLRADPGPDYGVHDLITQVYSQNPLVDGGQFSFESAPVRKMVLPLLVKDTGGPTTTNLCTNPSFEVDTAGWFAYSTLTRVTTDAKFGTACAAITTPATSGTNVADSPTATVVAGQVYTISGYFKGPVGKAIQLRANDSVNVTTASFACDGTWQRVSVTTVPISGTVLLLRIQTADASGGTFYIDGVQIEHAAAASAYCDGDQPLCQWNGAPNASTSTRTQVTVNIAEQLLTLFARPGAVIDLQPDGVPTAEMVRFDILGGRVNHDPYSVPLQRVGRRYLRLDLDTQPFGYWPTWVMLASAMAVVPPFTVPIARASIIGDAPAFARLAIVPTTAASAAGLYAPDFVAWGIGPASAPVWLSGASTSNLRALSANLSDPNASVIGGIGTITRIVIPPAGATWATVPQFTISVADPVRGRFRAYGYFRAADAKMLQVAVDVRSQNNAPMASAAPIATVFSASVAGVGASPAYSMFDLGEVALPHSPAGSYAAAISGGTYTTTLRFWLQAPSIGGASWNCDFAGVALVPVGGVGGVLPYGLGYPSFLQVYGSGNIMMLTLDAYRKAAGLQVVQGQVVAFDRPPAADAYGFYRGQLPMVGASDAAALVVHAENRQTATAQASWMPATRGGPAPRISYSLEYRPAFQFLKGL